MPLGDDQLKMVSPPQSQDEVDDPGFRLSPQDRVVFKMNKQKCNLKLLLLSTSSDKMFEATEKEF